MIFFPSPCCEGRERKEKIRTWQIRRFVFLTRAVKKKRERELESESRNVSPKPFSEESERNERIGTRQLIIIWGFIFPVQILE